MRIATFVCVLSACMLAAVGIPAQTPAVGFDLENARGHNYYYTNFFVNQSLGVEFEVIGGHDLTVTHLGAFDMNPDNEPFWDVPVYAQHGFGVAKGVALFERSSMGLIAEVILPAGTAAPIQDEGFRYLALHLGFGQWVGCQCG